jgi:hypothetical protein
MPFALFGMGAIIYRSAEHLGLVAIPIGIFSLLAMFLGYYATRKYPEKRLIIGFFTFLALFHSAGFTQIAYGSLEDAWGFYGDFHGSYAPTLIERDSINPPLLGLWFVETKLVTALLKTDNMTALLIVSLISRVMAAVAFAGLGAVIGRGTYSIALGSTAFAFSYLLIPFTQGIKFITGLPFFLLWLAGYLKTYEGRRGYWAALEITAGTIALFSEQWIILLMAAVYTFMPLIRAGTEGMSAITQKDAFGGMLSAIASLGIAAAEAMRLVSGSPPILSLQTHAHREPYSAGLYALYIVYVIAIFIGCVIAYRKASPHNHFQGRSFLLFGFIFPILLAIGKHLVVMPNILAIMKPISIYWIIGAPFWIAAAKNITLKKKIMPQEAACMGLTAFAAFMPTLPLFGFFIPGSPYLEGIAFALLVLCFAEGEDRSLQLPAILALSGIWAWQFLEYAAAWHRLGIMGLITVGALLCVIRQTNTIKKNLVSPAL